LYLYSASMKNPKYPVEASAERHTYEFYSEGPKGTIKKTVIYSQVVGNLYNLGFGDWKEQIHGLDDSSRSIYSRAMGTLSERKKLYSLLDYKEIIRKFVLTFMSKANYNKEDIGITVVHNMRDYSKDPFILKKVEQARAFIAKHGLPKEGKRKKAK
jgi:hypothetical protein